MEENRFKEEQQTTWNYETVLLLKRNVLLKLRGTKTRPIITTYAFIYALTKPINAF